MNERRLLTNEIKKLTCAQLNFRKEVTMMQYYICTVWVPVWYNQRPNDAVEYFHSSTLIKHHQFVKMCNALSMKRCIKCVCVAVAAAEVSLNSPSLWVSLIFFESLQTHTKQAHKELSKKLAFKQCWVQTVHIIDANKVVFWIFIHKFLSYE